MLRGSASLERMSEASRARVSFPWDWEERRTLVGTSGIVASRGRALLVVEFFLPEEEPRLAWGSLEVLDVPV